MSKDDLDRLRDTLAYIESLPDLSPAHVAQLRAARAADTKASRRISLGMRSGAKDPLETRRRRALRALLLCMDWAGCADQIPDAKRSFAEVGIDVLDDAVSGFFPLASASASTVIRCARGYRPEMGESPRQKPWQPHHLGRAAVLSGHSPMGGNCYAGVAIWLYLGGAVSLRWLHEHGSQPGSDLPTWGRWDVGIDTPAAAQTIPSGRVCRLQKPALHHGGLHYVITVALGQCVGVNNSVDIVHAWDHRTYGRAPSTICSTFPLAGYLAGMPRGSTIRTTSCLPPLQHTF